MQQAGSTLQVVPEEPDVWNVKEVAAYLRISVWQVRKLAKTGVLPGIRVGDWRFHRPTILAIVQNSATR